METTKYCIFFIIKPICMLDCKYFMAATSTLNSHFNNRKREREREPRMMVEIRKDRSLLSSSSIIIIIIINNLSHLAKL